MLVEQHKDTLGASSGWFAVEDIDRRAALAVERHPEVFDSAAHQQSVRAVVALAKQYFAGYNAIYETARAATALRPANTEVKVSRFAMKTKRNSAQFAADIAAAGGRMIVWKHNTDSVSIHVW
jgi:hypothetical protein